MIVRREQTQIVLARLHDEDPIERIAVQEL
jgi:hypothetical protein